MRLHEKSSTFAHRSTIPPSLVHFHASLYQLHLTHTAYVDLLGRVGTAGVGVTTVTGVGATTAGVVTITRTGVEVRIEPSNEQLSVAEYVPAGALVTGIFPYDPLT